MKKGCIIGGVILGGLILLIFIIASWVISKHDIMVKKDENVKAQWGNVNTAYQKRFDLVDNLVNTVKGAADYERGTLEAVIAQRAKASQTVIDASNLTQQNIEAFQQAQAGLSASLSRLLATFERYPDLKANQNFLSLQTELSSLEQEILHERTKYNESAKDFNQFRNTAVNSFVAGFFPKFAEKGYFTSEDGAENVPEIEFDFNKEE